MNGGNGVEIGLYRRQPLRFDTGFVHEGGIIITDLALTFARCRCGGGVLDQALDLIIGLFNQYRARTIG